MTEPFDFAPLADIEVPVKTRSGMTFTFRLKGDPKFDQYAMMTRWVDDESDDDRYTRSLHLLRTCFDGNAEALETIEDHGARWVTALALVVIRYWQTGVLPEQSVEEGDNPKASVEDDTFDS